LPGLLKRLDELEAAVRKELVSQGFRDAKGEITVERFLNMRYLGTDTLIQTQQPADSTDFAAVFEREYRDEFGFVLANKVTVDDVRCRGTGKTYSSLPPSPLTEFAGSTYTPVDVSAASTSVTSVYFPATGRVDVPVFRLEDVRLRQALPAGVLCTANR
jgi:5-oxoprolinase (ATP-hydrolysing)